jgi:toxin FitB
MAGSSCRSSRFTRSKRASRCSGTKARRALKAWLAGLLAAYGDKILGLDAAGASFSGKLEAKAACAGHNPGMADAIVAGVAQANDLVVVTRNAKHFLPLGE